MNIIDWTHATTITTDELPAGIGTYLAAHRARDLAAALAYYDDASTVTDEGRTYTGREAIRAWLASAATEYTYTIELVGAARLDDAHYDVLHHLEGDFPGGVADLHFRFTLRCDLIADLVIEP
jgi:ketosteroid isomerase-like protein